MGKTEQLKQVSDSGIVAVIRARSSERLVDVAEALLAGGITVMEVTFTVPNALRTLEKMADQVGDRALLGAGTVLDCETGRAAMLAGAEFIVSPSTNVDLIRLCRRYDKAIMPGALTPTEVVAAWEAGADIVKVFPADSMGGAPYLKALHGPLPQVSLMPTGGVNLETAADFLRAGAVALGIGGSLVDSKTVEAGDMARIESLAKQYVDIVRTTRENDLKK
jgi:2-dehydro-3-deoxyphosphogluconate aldolase / (4S)-4-hydroxy-2-oxoglutarate aldolase